MSGYIVSLTTWKQRVEYVGETIFSFMTQTIPPTKIILNLSKVEFPSISSLPNSVLLLKNKFNNLIDICLLDGNTKAFKKVIPTLKKYKNTHQLVITADDDMFYLPTYAAFMLTLVKLYPNCYFSPGTWGNHVHGYAMIYDTSWFKDDLLYSLTPHDMDEICSSDLWITECLSKSNIICKCIPEIAKFIINKSLENTALSHVYTNIPFDERRQAVFNAEKKYYETGNH